MTDQAPASSPTAMASTAPPPERITFAEGCVCYALRRAARAATQAFDDRLRPSGLRVTQLSLLAAVSNFGPITMQRLAERLGMDRTTLKRNLAPLLRDGLIAVAPGADRRERAVAITTEGHARAMAAIPLWRIAQDEAVARVGAERWRAMRAELRRFSDPGPADGPDMSDATGG